MRGTLAGLVAGLATRSHGGLRLPATLAALGSCLGGLALLDWIASTSAWLWLAAGVALAAIVAAVTAALRARLPRSSMLGIALAAVCGCTMWTLGLMSGPYAPLLRDRLDAYSRPVVAEHYAFDGEIYLRTRALMKNGTPFYAAFQRAWQEDARFEGRIATPLGFREPALFYVWSILPGTTGASLLGWFIAFALVVGLAGWWFASTFVNDGAALLAPIALCSYFAFLVFSQRSWFTFAEPWAAGVLLVAMTLLVRRHWLASAAGLVAAVSIRELAVLFVPVWVAAWVMSGRARRGAASVAIAIAGSATVLLLHVLLAPASGGAGHLSVSTWLHSTGLPRLVRALQHGMELVPHGKALAPLLPVLALGGAVCARERWQRWALAMAVVVPVVFLLMISADPYDYYWGAVLTPVLLSMMPLGLARLLPREDVT